MSDGAIETRIEFMYKGFLWPSKVFEHPDGRVETDIADPLCPTHLQPASGMVMGPFHLLCPQGDREATLQSDRLALELGGPLVHYRHDDTFTIGADVDQPVDQSVSQQPPVEVHDGTLVLAGLAPALGLHLGILDLVVVLVQDLVRGPDPRGPSHLPRCYDVQGDIATSGGKGKFRPGDTATHQP